MFAHASLLIHLSPHFQSQMRMNSLPTTFCYNAGRDFTSMRAVSPLGNIAISLSSAHLFSFVAIDTLHHIFKDRNRTACAAKQILRILPSLLRRYYKGCAILALLATCLVPQTPLYMRAAYYTPLVTRPPYLCQLFNVRLSPVRLVCLSFDDGAIIRLQPPFSKTETPRTRCEIWNGHMHV